uniref:AlkB homolog 1, histone H2A dioxygenase n=1 Tax=Amphiprion percula TaxID=161767 RepID=A0A3P8SJP5_AMPPE
RRGRRSGGVYSRLGVQQRRGSCRAHGCRAIGAGRFIFISNLFLLGSQSYWVRQCLKIYPQKTNICNLDMHMSPSDTKDIWGKSVHALSSPTGKKEPKTHLERLRWVTLGYHYKWDTKTYSANSYTPFPADLHLLSLQVTAACGFPGFNSEAGILNYYRPDSSLGIHVDESELDHTRPLLSFSWLQEDIFLHILAFRICLNIEHCNPLTGGDMMLMSGQSRLLYHAGQRILPAPQGHTTLEMEGCSLTLSLQGDAVVELVSEEDWALCSRYIHNSRVNVTVRQVLGPGQNFPETPSPLQRTDTGFVHRNGFKAAIKRRKLFSANYL